MIGAAVLLFIYALNKKISRVEGAIMLAAFVAYNIYLISTQTLNSDKIHTLRGVRLTTLCWTDSFCCWPLAFSY
jgi:Ca2+/Na+ antiporter